MRITASHRKNTHIDIAAVIRYNTHGSRRALPSALGKNGQGALLYCDKQAREY